MSEPQVQWLIENGPFDENISSLCEEIEKRGMCVHTMRGMPFEDEILTDFQPEDCVVVLGSINFVRRIQRTKRWVPGALVNWDNYRFSTCAAYGLNSFNHAYTLDTWAGFKKYWTDESVPDDAEIFIKPNEGNKGFSGCVLRKSDKYDITYIDSKIKPDTLVVWATPKPIVAEYRFIVADGKVIAGSQYKDNVGLKIQSEYPYYLPTVINRLLAKASWVPDRMFTVDIAFSNESQFGILELNSFNCSGLYACPLEPIIREATRIAVEEWKEVH